MPNVSLIRYFSVSLGGVIGANLRFLIVSKIRSIPLNSKSRLLIINSLACFILGLLFPLVNNYSVKDNTNLIYFFSLGFITGLSTFSGLIYDLFKYIENKNYKSFMVLFLFSIISGMCFFCCGYLLSKI